MSSQSERPASPCIGYCSTALGDEVCRGCGRTFTEVANWVFMTTEEKEKVWLRLEAGLPRMSEPPCPPDDTNLA